MKKSTLTIAAGIALSLASLSSFAAANSSAHYGAPHKAGSAMLTTNTADNFDAVNHDPYNTYNVSIPGWSGTLDTNPNPDQPDPPSCTYCQVSTHINSWPTTIYVNGYAYTAPKAGPITYFDIYPSNKQKGKATAMTTSHLKPRVVIHQ